MPSEKPLAYALISQSRRDAQSIAMNPDVAAVGYVLRLDSTKAMMTDPDQHACGLQPQEQQSLAPDGTPTTSTGRSLETAARALLRARPRRTGLPTTAGRPAPARR